MYGMAAFILAAYCVKMVTPQLPLADSLQLAGFTLFVFAVAGFGW